MSRVSLIVLVGVSLLLAGALGYWLSRHLVERTERVETPPGPEARSNPLLAATRLLERSGRAVEASRERRLLHALPSTDDALVLYGVEPPRGDRQLDALVQWVGQGGLLVLDVAHLWQARGAEARSPLLERLGVRVVETDQRGSDPVGVWVEDQDTPVTVGFRPRFRLLDDGDAAVFGVVAGDGQGYYLLDYEVGDGLLTVVNDLDMISNDRIGEREHAYFLDVLLVGTQPAWLLYDPLSPSLPALAWRHARAVLVTLALLIVVALWAANARIGPRLRAAGARRRDQRAHLVACGLFDALHRLDGERIAALRDAVEQEWMLRHAGLAALDRRGRAEWIARHGDEEVDDVFAALYGETHDDLHRVAHVALLQRLWLKQ